MTETTTIEITTEQKAELNSMGFGSYKAALAHLIENYNSQSDSAIGSYEQEFNEAEVAEALADYLINGENLPEKVANELKR